MITLAKDGSAEEIPTSLPQAGPLTPVRQETGTCICISLLGELRVWLEMNGSRVEVPVKSQRRQELLAYIATMAPERGKRVTSGRILTDVFEHIAPRADVDNLRGLFQKHTQLLRKEINEVAEKANFPKVQLFQYEKVDNSSTKWWLSEECKVVDLAAVKLLHEQTEAIKEVEEAGSTTLKAVCDQLISLYQSYQGDYLERHLLDDMLCDADWVQVPFTEYRTMYLQALWDAAICEHITSTKPDISEQERYRCAKRAANLYRTYALHAPRYQQFDSNARKSKRQSERALRGCLRMCKWFMDAQAADDSYSLYEKLMMEEFPEWKPAAKTIELLRSIRQQTGHNLSLSGLLEPPDE